MSRIIHLSWQPGGIAVVKMEDRVTHNRSSRQFDQEMEEAFSAIAAEPAARVVVIHGYDTYFSCGGAREELMSLVEKRAVFTDFLAYDQLMRCELPVIAAMQGHAIGGGLSFGCFADLMVLSEEGIYSANFMHLGLTPGVGATWAIPHRFGPTLGWELLWSANNYRGTQLRARGAMMPILKREEVIPHALSLAQDIAEKPVLALKQMKRHYVSSVRADLDAAIQKELAMHEIIFSQPGARERVEAQYPT